MKQTIQEMKAALEAFEKDGKVEWTANGKHWAVISDPKWDFCDHMYRPVQKPVKYLCYEGHAGELRWFREGSSDEKYFINHEACSRIPELDKEVTR